MGARSLEVLYFTFTNASVSELSLDPLFSISVHKSWDIFFKTGEFQAPPSIGGSAKTAISMQGGGAGAMGSSGGAYVGGAGEVGRLGGFMIAC
jgi:hypothetical protein